MIIVTMMMMLAEGGEGSAWFLLNTHKFLLLRAPCSPNKPLPHLATKPPFENVADDIDDDDWCDDDDDDEYVNDDDNDGNDDDYDVPSEHCLYLWATIILFFEQAVLVFRKGSLEKKSIISASKSWAVIQTHCFRT